MKVEIFIIINCLLCMGIVSCTKTDTKKDIIPPDKEKGAKIEEDCPSKIFFQTIDHPVNVYLLEYHYLKCLDFLKNNPDEYSLKSMEINMEETKIFIIRNLADCLLLDDPVEPCFHRIFISSVNHRTWAPRHYYEKQQKLSDLNDPRTGKEKNKQIYKSNSSRSEARYPGQGGAGASVSRVTAPQKNIWRFSEIDANLIDWNNACTFHKSEITAQSVDVDDLSLKLLSDECTRITKKLVAASQKDRSPKGLARSIIENEPIPENEIKRIVDYINSRPSPR